MNKFKSSQLKIVGLSLIGSFVFFTWGLGVGKYEIFPYQYLEFLNSFGQTRDHGQKNQIENNLFELAFTDNIIESELIYEPLSTLDDILEMNTQILVELDDFELIYDRIELIDSQLFYLDSGVTPILKVQYKFGDKQFDAYAYAILDQGVEPKTSTLVIPGSGLNQAALIFQRNPDNYHFGIFEILNELQNNDSFIFIQPNEGVLAFHDGKHKLNYNFITNFHLNNGGSYSASYLIQTIALEKHLKINYSQTVVIGLSQGGLATMINALESKPDIAIVSSGYSVLSGKVEWSGHDQIIFPGIAQRLNADSVFKELSTGKTSWLFTYGLKEKGIYKMEADQMLTAAVIDNLSNVDVEVHPEGHRFPVDQVKSFIKEKLN